jgi:CubicO group peptidase (beta-lactamase class C family)
MHSRSSLPDGPKPALPLSCALIEQGLRSGLHFGAQVYASVDGRTTADFGLGEARPGVAMTADTLVLWLSAGKPLGAAAILQLCDRGKLDLDDPVSKHISEFAQHGKADITLRHLLTHTGGFRFVDIEGPGLSWDDIIRRISAAKAERGWLAGRKAGYHPLTSWYILGEVVRRVDGRWFGDYVREEIFVPLGMIDSWIGLGVEQFQAYGDRFGLMRYTEKQSPSTHRYDADAFVGVCVPGGNARGPMHDLGRFYQMLLGGGVAASGRVLSPRGVELMTTPQRVGMYDETFKHVMDWGLGTIIDSNRYGPDTVPYGFGKYSSPRTFGHGGSQSSIGFADPEHKLVAAVAFNGMPGEQKHDARMRALLAALYEDLHLA